MQHQTRAAGEAAASLPPEFDPAVYRELYPDLRALGDAELAAHYVAAGRKEGRAASVVRRRGTFAALIPPDCALLEIGPFANPLRQGPKVKYFDVLTTEELRERAKVHRLDPAKCPHIDFVSPTGDLAIVEESFDAVLSCHVIEHQPDLVRHLREVSRILKPGGLYFLVVPDKRYCFDYFIAESNLAEIFAAHARGAREHDALSIIEHRALTTHNDPLRHWAGDHGEPLYRANPQTLRDAAEFCLRSHGRYVDVHAWQFVPDSFAEAMRVLFDLRLSALHVLRVYPTPAGSNEFYVVLERAPEECRPLESALPADFDAAQYLLANPDVARAGADPAEHYLRFGRHERRRLRP